MKCHCRSERTLSAAWATILIATIAATVGLTIATSHTDVPWGLTLFIFVGMGVFPAGFFTVLQFAATARTEDECDIHRHP